MKNVNTLSLNVNELVKGSENIKGLFSGIKAEGAKLDKQIQIALASGAIHAHVHGDWGMAITALESLSKGMRTTAARGYIEAFYPVRWNKKTKTFVFEKSLRFADIETNPELTDMYQALLTTDWLSFKPAKETTIVDTVGSVEALIKRLTNAMETEGNKVSQVEIDILARAMDEINTLRTASVTE